jgi:hypothetical protein
LLWIGFAGSESRYILFCSPTNKVLI